MVAALILSGFSVSSGVLFIQVRSQESYLTFESIALLVCFAIALVNLLWIAPRCYFSYLPEDALADDRVNKHNATTSTRNSSSNKITH